MAKDSYKNNPFLKMLEEEIYWFRETCNGNLPFDLESKTFFLGQY
jgi:hypothetical protein